MRLIEGKAILESAYQYLLLGDGATHPQEWQGRETIAKLLRTFPKIQNETPPKCHICGRLLNNPEDKDSSDYGGDCEKCITQIEKDLGFKTTEEASDDGFRLT
jgi:hypothetical protein